MKHRIVSVDVMRGITIAAMVLVNNPGTWSHIYPPLGHAEWHGYTPTDLVFPFFLFIVGCSIAFAYRGRRPSVETYRKIAVRSLKLIGLGIFLGAFLIVPPFIKPWAEIRLPGVLQRIGLVFCIAAPLALHLRSRHLLFVALGLLLGYWALLGGLPLPNGPGPTYERAAGNWAMYVDKLVLGTHTWKADYDPEGLLSTLPAVATCLIGVLAGRFLLSGEQVLSRLFGVGLLLVIVGQLWGLVLPINKALWTSSFVVVTAGWALLVLGAIYYLTDVRGWTRGGVFARAGANALILFFLSSFFAKVFYSVEVGDTNLHDYLYQTIFSWPFLPPEFSSLLYALVLVTFYLWLGTLLYHRGVFVKV